MPEAVPAAEDVIEQVIANEQAVAEAAVKKEAASAVPASSMIDSMLFKMYTPSSPPSPPSPPPPPPPPNVPGIRSVHARLEGYIFDAIDEEISSDPRTISPPPYPPGLLTNSDKIEVSRQARRDRKTLKKVGRDPLLLI